MPDKIYIGNFKGLVLNRKPFNIDNDTFMTLFDAYAWRGQVKRKRGTSPLARLQRQIQLANPVAQPWQKALSTTLDSVNLIVDLGLGAGSSITPRTINFVIAGDTYTEPLPPDGTLLKNGLADPGSSINYATGVLVFIGKGSVAITGTFSYYPDLPVMGLEDFVSNSDDEQFPLLIAFDTKYAYEIKQSGTPFFYGINYYKNTNVPFVWSGANYQQFWSTNYQHAFWATNNKPGFNFKAIQSIAWVNATQLTIVVNNTAGISPVIVGDYVWTYEITTNTTVNIANKLNSVNSQTGKVAVIVEAPPGTFTLTVNFPNSTIIDPAAGDAGKVYSGGIIQLLTNTIAGQDGIKWYDGDPTNGTGIPTATGLGWVNFSPPLSQGLFDIDDEVEAIYYLVGALHIIPFKDRLLFSSPWIQTSVGNATPIQLQDVMLWSWNGTPYYNSLVPTGQNFNETFDARAYYVDQTGFAGYLPAGISKPIKTLAPCEDVLLIGFGGTGKKTRFIYTGNDLQPFLFYIINSDMPSASTFSALAINDGMRFQNEIVNESMVDVGQYGICITNQQTSKRVDLEIPDEVFKIQALNNGQDRVNAVRNFYKEWIYFTYPTGDGKATTGSYIYPSNTFMWNYRDGTWAILRENYTHQGTFRNQTGYTWNNLPFSTWERWREPWDAGSTTDLFPDVIAGNPQGYVVQKDDEGTGEAPSGDIQAIANAGLGSTRITSINHCVNIGDYLYFLGALGYISLNNQIGCVINVVDANTFDVDIGYTSGTYLGLGTYTRLSQPLIQTKQFPFYWDQGRKTRIGVQKYLLDSTNNGQITLNIYLSQDPNTVWNEGPITPNIDTTNGSLVYSQKLWTCPELPSSNIGITNPNTNLLMTTAATQDQIWHRESTSMIGDTVQIGFTLSDEQMRSLTELGSPANAMDEIVIHAMQLDVHPGPYLS